LNDSTIRIALAHSKLNKKVNPHRATSHFPHLNTGRKASISRLKR